MSYMNDEWWDEDDPDDYDDWDEYEYDEPEPRPLTLLERINVQINRLLSIANRALPHRWR